MPERHLDIQFVCSSTVQSATICAVLEFDMHLQLHLLGIHLITEDGISD